MTTQPHTNTPPSIIVNEAYLNQRLDNFLLTKLKPLPKSCLYRLLRQGHIRVNKKRQKPSYRIQGNDIIRLPNITSPQPQHASTSTLSPPPSLYPSSSLTKALQQAILFENSSFLIINKPHGIAAHGGSGISSGLIESLRQIYPTIPHLSLVHRLDKDTSGCLLLAKKPASLRALHTLFRDKTIKKTYLLLTQGTWPKQLHTIDQPLKKNQLASQERIVKIHPNGQAAYTQYTLLEHFKHASLLEATPLTGRTHQIRVHAQYAKHPIAGDTKYGDKAFNQAMREKGLKRLFLHAHQLSFYWAETKENIHIKAPLPLELQSLLKKDI